MPASTSPPINVFLVKICAPKLQIKHIRVTQSKAEVFLNIISEKPGKNARKKKRLSDNKTSIVIMHGRAFNTACVLNDNYNLTKTAVKRLKTGQM